MRIISILTLLLICACAPTPDKNNQTAFNETDTNIKKENNVVLPDTSLANREVNVDTVTRKITKKNKTTTISYIRMEAVPRDNNFNGEPMVQQIELASKILQFYPDTLVTLAKERYAGYDRYFPVSVQDNFEEGISTERIHYPKLIFEFQLFENEYASKPYLVKQISIRKEINGTLTAE